MYLIVQRDQRRHAGAAAVVEFRQQRAPHAQRFDVEKFAAYFGVAAAGLQQRGEFLGRERGAVADEHVDVQLEPVALAVDVGRARGDRDVDRRFAGGHGAQRVVEHDVDVVPIADHLAHERRRALDVVQRERIAAARHEAGLEEAVREDARRGRCEAHEAAGVGRDRAVDGERGTRVALAIDERQARDQRTVAPAQTRQRRRRFRVDDTELAAVFGREERRDARDRADRGMFAVGRGAVGRHAVGRGCRHDAARIETVVEQVRGAVDDQPRRRSVDDQRSARGEALAVAALECRDELVALAHGAQAQAAHVDVERHEFDRMPVGAGFVIEARARMARQAKQRAGEGALRNARAERFLNCLVADQLAVGVVPVVGGRGFHHRQDRFRIANHAAQARRIEIQRARERLAVGRGDHGPDAARARPRRFEIDGGQPRQVDLRIGGIGRQRRFVGAAHRFERRHDVFAHAGRTARADAAQGLRSGTARPLDAARDAAAIGDGRLDLRALDGA